MAPFVPLLLISKHTHKLLNFFFFVFLVKSQSLGAPDVALLCSSESDLARIEVFPAQMAKK